MSWLVLTRKQGESIYIDTPTGRVVVKVLKIDDGRVQLGIEAPREMNIVRDELELKGGTK